MVPSAPLAPRRRRWVGARAEGGQEAVPPRRREEVNGKTRIRRSECQQLQKSQLRRLWGRGTRGQDPPALSPAPLEAGAAAKGSGGRARGAKSALRAGGCAGLVLLPGLRDPSLRRRGARGRGRGRGRASARRLCAGSRASPRAAARRWPSPRRLRAGSCSPTDWRGPASRLKGAPTSRPPGRHGPLEGVSARPAGPHSVLGGRGASGEPGGGGRGDGVTAPGAAAGRCHSLPPPAPSPARFRGRVPGG